MFSFCFTLPLELEQYSILNAACCYSEYEKLLVSNLEHSLNLRSSCSLNGVEIYATYSLVFH